MFRPAARGPTLGATHPRPVGLHFNFAVLMQSIVYASGPSGAAAWPGAGALNSLAQGPSSVLPPSLHAPAGGGRRQASIGPRPWAVWAGHRPPQQFRLMSWGKRGELRRPHLDNLDLLSLKAFVG